MAMLQNYKELLKAYALVVDFKRWLRRYHLEVVKSWKINFILKLLVQFYNQCHKF